MSGNHWKTGTRIQDRPRLDLFPRGEVERHGNFYIKLVPLSGFRVAPGRTEKKVTYSNVVTISERTPMVVWSLGIEALPRIQAVSAKPFYCSRYTHCPPSISTSTLMFCVLSNERERCFRNLNTND